MAKKYNFWIMLAMALAVGMAVAGCGGDDENEAKKTPPTLPAPKGANALSGKTYVDWDEKIAFDATAEGATQGTYTKKNVVYVQNNGPDLDESGKHKYVDIETGSYSWDAEANTVTLLPAKVASWKSDDSGYGDPLDKEAWKAALRATVPAGITDGTISEMTGGQYTTITAYINALADDAFKSVTNNYAFSNDAKALFLDEKLTANKGSNELSDKKYYGTSWNEDDEEVKDETKTYEFKADGTCTYTRRYSQPDSQPDTQTYIYAYDSSAKMVYLKVPTEGRADRYSQVSSNTYVGNFASADEYNAAQVNYEFNRMETYKYGTSGADNILERR